ncbi:restriction endonuclease subunit S [Ralstonia chuxiongensis]|uniref:restriction endonuclease subunit S n=1 Tax=Ralstonia chuxiongensis TaxID=2957504 RepID=UPI0028F5CD5B|nr:restriction endonuclease subunit S [Ralstonia chuxiongensis]CAJ0776344.1 hypothetical protein R8510_04230 [Ralstonia chuxiongensis]
MKLKPYPKYMPSGLEWLGDLPAHWKIVPLKHVLVDMESGTSVNAIDVPASSGEFGVLKTSCVYGGEFIAAENKAVVPEEFDRVSCPLRRGTLIVSRMNTPELVGAAGLVRRAEAGLFLPDRLWQVSFHDAEPAFAHYWTQTAAYRVQVEMACSGTSSSMQNLSQGQFRSFAFPRPSVAEQVAIAAYLDRETAKIDTLIAKQEKLIELLQEKRQAVISHAVMKGLDPMVPMKPSGVAWLGDVPEHWEVGPIKRFFSFLDGKRVPLSAEERGVRAGDYPYYGASGIIDSVDDYIFDEDLVLVSEDGANLLARSTPIAFVARGKYWVNNHAHVLKPVDEHLTYWSERIEAENLVPFVSGSAQPKLTIQALANILIAVPPSANERQEIEAYILSESAKIGTLIAKAQQAIALQKEHRTALISAAVTGKIDVRGMVDQESYEEKAA